jgi:hypothetical protein
VTQLPASLIPRSDERGLASTEPDRLASTIAQSWNLFTALVEPLDLDTVTRAKGLTAREIVIPLGAWDDNRPLARLVLDARNGVVGVHDQSALVDAVRDAHRHESDVAIVDALRRQGEQMTTFLYGEDVSEVGAAPVASMLGTLPLLTFLLAATYPLATSSLDLESAGAVVPDALLDNGLLGVVDVIGALAARQGITASLCAVTPTGVVATAAQEGAWRTTLLEGSEPLGPAVEGPARVLLEMTAGRANVADLVRRPDFALHDVTGLLELAGIVEQVPGIPGRTALVAAIRATRSVSSLMRRLPFGR